MIAYSTVSYSLNAQKLHLSVTVISCTFLIVVLIAETYDGNDNCKLKRATTEMEDLLTDLIEGMESRKTKLTTIV